MPINISPKAIAAQMQAADMRLQPFRASRRSHVQEIVGRWYGKDPGGDNSNAQIINLLQQMVMVLTPALVGGPVRTMVTPKSPVLAVEAERRRAGLDRTCDDVNLRDVFERWIVGALMGAFSVVKVGRRSGESLYDVDGRYFDVGRPYATTIDMDDFLVDADCRDLDEARIMAHRHRIHRTVALESGLFNQDMVMRAPTVRQRMSERTDEMSKATRPTQGTWDIDDVIELWEVYLFGSSETTCLTLAAGQNGSAGTLVGDVENWAREPYTYEGPERGPFEILSLGMPVDGQPFSLCHADMIRDLHRAVARVSNVVVQQMLSTKRVHAFRRSAIDDADNIRLAKNGQWVAVDDPASVTSIDSGGIDPQLTAAVEWLINQFDGSPIGNLSMAAGKDVPARTATNGSILQANLNRHIGYSQQRANIGADRVIKQLAYHWDLDPLRQEMLPMRLENGETIEWMYDAQAKEADWDRYDYRVARWQMQPLDPEVRVARLLELFREVLPLPVLIQMGLTTPEHALRVIGRDMGVDNADEIITSAGSPMPQIPMPQPIGARSVGRAPQGPAFQPGDGASQRNRIGIAAGSRRV